ncbi:hypothetical protein [Serratia marcescens]|uniref:hypothetical protein n=1 Tax=Serratia marcescens TaxID=615 RepID=UPI0029D918F4|nr:hypothetical protein [Serratia marcescens]
MNPLQPGRSMPRQTALAGEPSGQPACVDTPSPPALPAALQVGDHTFPVGRVVTALSGFETELLHHALHGDTPKEPLSDSPDSDGVFSYTLGAKDYFDDGRLPAYFPERMMATCALNATSGLEQMIIRDMHSENIYCHAHFDSSATAQRSEPEAATFQTGRCKHKPGGMISLETFTGCDVTDDELKSSEKKAKSRVSSRKSLYKKAQELGVTAFANADRELRDARARNRGFTNRVEAQRAEKDNLAARQGFTSRQEADLAKKNERAARQGFSSWQEAQRAEREQRAKARGYTGWNDEQRATRKSRKAASNTENT